MISPSPPPPPSSSIASSSSTPLPHHHRQHHHGGGDESHLGEPPRDAIVETAQTRKHLKYAGAEKADKLFWTEKKGIHYFITKRTCIQQRECRRELLQVLQEDLRRHRTVHTRSLSIIRLH